MLRDGFNTLWTNDHLVSPHSTVDTPQLECWTLLSTLARLTSKIRLGTLVTCNPLRHPALLAKMAATLDNISRGRLEFGIGTGWKMEDFHMVGKSPPPGQVKLAQLEESLQLVLRLWSEEKVSFTGKYYTVKEGYCVPKPIQKPHPPILLGVGTGRTGIKLIAKYANKYNFEQPSPEEYQKKIPKSIQNANASEEKAGSKPHVQS